MFFLSGFCGLLYQVVWLRGAYVSFGIITPVLSVVLSVFMLGLALGTWAGGRLIHRLRGMLSRSAILFYAIIELLIGVWAFFVPRLFFMGEEFMLGAGEMGSAYYLAMSSAVITAVMLPCCVLMGLTFPFMMAYAGEWDDSETDSFSYLYLANVIGAMCGSFFTAFVLIELIGLNNTLMLAVLANFLIAGISFTLAAKEPLFSATKKNSTGSGTAATAATGPVLRDSMPMLALLFMTGFTSMALEVVWIRDFTPVLGNKIYAFSGLLSVYLLATWLGSCLYRFHLARNKALPAAKLAGLLALTVLFPLVLNDPRIIRLASALLISIFPFCAFLGYLTPKLVDELSLGNPVSGGRAYAANIIGCILGPLSATYFLLPLFGVKVSMIILALPYFILFALYYRAPVLNRDWVLTTAILSLCVLAHAALLNHSHEEADAHGYPDKVIRRDHTATVISYGSGLDKKILVNGIGMTSLRTITKVMAHLPMAFHAKGPESSLVICFGMGATYRSLMSWDKNATAVELVPGVKNAFGYYFDDADKIVRNPKGKIVVDDGRRFLKRAREKFDVITLDPPPPVEAAGSGLLYSPEFYSLLKKRLNKNGVLQQWFPGSRKELLQAAARSLSISFEHIKVFKSIDGWGHHFIASMEPLDNITPEIMERRMPASAKTDLLEWEDSKDVIKLAKNILSREAPMEEVLAGGGAGAMITDDRPYNEFFLLRRTFPALFGDAE